MRFDLGGDERLVVVLARRRTTAIARTRGLGLEIGVVIAARLHTRSSGIGDRRRATQRWGGYRRNVSRRGPWRGVLIGRGRNGSRLGRSPASSRRFRCGDRANRSHGGLPRASRHGSFGRAAHAGHSTDNGGTDTGLLEVGEYLRGCDRAGPLHERVDVPLADHDDRDDQVARELVRDRQVESGEVQAGISHVPPAPAVAMTASRPSTIIAPWVELRASSSAIA